MINDNKRVLEHFNNLLDKTKENEKVEVYRQNIKYLVNKLEKYFTQTEQLQELTDEIYQHLEDKESLEQQNKRYREAIEKIKNKISKQLEGLDAEEEMQRVVELSELMTMTIEALEGEE